jgi:hypothetical protein
VDDPIWTDEFGDDCVWWANNDPGCTIYIDYGQHTACRLTCNSCPSINEAVAFKSQIKSTASHKLVATNKTVDSKNAAKGGTVTKKAAKGGTVDIRTNASPDGEVAIKTHTKPVGN